jgi:hypothetical protein
MARGQVWFVTLVLTLIGIGLLVAIHAAAVSYAYGTIGDGVYLIVAAAGLGIALVIGRVVGWLNQA